MCVNSYLLIRPLKAMTKLIRQNEATKTALKKGFLSFYLLYNLYASQNEFLSLFALVLLLQSNKIRVVVVVVRASSSSSS